VGQSPTQPTHNPALLRYLEEQLATLASCAYLVTLLLVHIWPVESVGNSHKSLLLLCFAGILTCAYLAFEAREKVAAALLCWYSY
jgi:hypothetical protein